MNILIAEDDAVSRTILRRTIEKLGHECNAVADGEEAWLTYQRSPEIDVVISDWMMPGKDGLELCRRVREETREGYTYFIFLTALTDRKHLTRGLEAGADDYLSKPLDRNELEARLIVASRVTSLHRQLARKRKELEETNVRLFEQARTDPLTGLGNRLQLYEDLERLKGRVERYGHSYCAVLCDVDLFKRHNAQHGHLVGDELLRKVAETISGQLRSGDTAYRYGEDEFLVILPEQTVESARVFASRLRRAVGELRISHRAQMPRAPAITIGITGLHTARPRSTDEFLREADAALRQARESNKQRAACDQTDRRAD